MECPECNSTHMRKNGIKKSKQNHICVDCGRQFINVYAPPQGYSDAMKRECSKVFMGFLSGLKACIIPPITWVDRLPNAYSPDKIPEVGELDELDWSKKTKSICTAVDHFSQGILGWVLATTVGIRSVRYGTIVATSYFYVTDGWSVYPGFIPDGDQIICKTYMTRVEGENTRLRHYLARLHRQTLCYSKSAEMLAYSIRLLLHYLKFGDVPVPA